MSWLLVNWRVALYGLAGAALVAILIGAGVMVAGWRQDSQRLPAVEAERDAAVQGRQAAERSLLDQTERNRRIEHDTNEALVRAGRAARDLSDRLRRHYAGLPRPQCPTAAAAGGVDGARQVEADGDRVDGAIAAHLAACADDAERLTKLQEWAQTLPKRCVVE